MKSNRGLKGIWLIFAIISFVYFGLYFVFRYYASWTDHSLGVSCRDYEYKHHPVRTRILALSYYVFYPIAYSECRIRGVRYWME